MSIRNLLTPGSINNKTLNLYANSMNTVEVNTTSIVADDITATGLNITDITTTEIKTNMISQISPTGLLINGIKFLGLKSFYQDDSETNYRYLIAGTEFNAANLYVGHRISEFDDCYYIDFGTSTAPGSFAPYFKFCRTGSIHVLFAGGKVLSNTFDSFTGTILKLGDNTATGVTIGKVSTTTTILGNTVTSDLKSSLPYLQIFSNTSSTTPIIVAGTWTPAILSNVSISVLASGFTVDTVTNIGEFTMSYGITNKVYEIRCALTWYVVLGAAQECEFSFWDTTGVPTIITPSILTNTAGVGVRRNSTIVFLLPVSVLNSKFRLYCRNNSGTDDIQIVTVNISSICLPV